jgi:hypothetical protein
MDDDLYVVESLGSGRMICISTLSKRLIAEAGAEHLGTSGYFIYEVDERPIIGGLTILAKATCFDSALRLAELWRERAPVQKKCRTPTSLAHA